MVPSAVAAVGWRGQWEDRWTQLDQGAWQDDAVVVSLRAPWRYGVGFAGPREPLHPRVGPALGTGRWHPTAGSARRPELVTLFVHINHLSWAQIALNHLVPSSSFPRQQAGSSEQPNHSSTLASDAYNGPRRGHRPVMSPQHKLPDSRAESPSCPTGGPQS